MENYFRVKSRIFASLSEDGTAVLNIDDPMVRRLTRELGRNIVTFGISGDAMISADNIEELTTESRDGGHMVPSGLSFDVSIPGGGFGVDTRLIGRFNVHNILASIGIAYALGISEGAIRDGVRKAEPVEGRFENVDEGQGFLCIVDYAHTEDALRKLIDEARFLTKRRVITLVGCGGDRDRSKRPLMGLTASEQSDIVFLTSDNPRTEDPMEIIRDMVKGMQKNNYTVQPDREKAIREAVSMANNGDTLLVAGKGHESYQEINGERHYFSDREVLKKVIRENLAGGDK
jgi:UDP-N-acetylmuramoyl-L-alanyl-D-glutamate--2,6-diaminopimelate ligase